MKQIKPRRAELIILAVLLLGLALWALLPRSTGGAVTVTIDGTDAGSYSLLADRRIPITGYAGYTLELVIENGSAHVEQASCPDLICQNHAEISKTGQQIICLPARTVITVTGSAGGENTEEVLPDAVVG